MIVVGPPGEAAPAGEAEIDAALREAMTRLSAVARRRRGRRRGSACRSARSTSARRSSRRRHREASGRVAVAGDALLREAAPRRDQTPATNWLIGTWLMMDGRTSSIRSPANSGLADPLRLGRQTYACSRAKRHLAARSGDRLTDDSCTEVDDGRRRRRPARRTRPMSHGSNGSGPTTFRKTYATATPRPSAVARGAVNAGGRARRPAGRAARGLVASAQGLADPAVRARTPVGEVDLVARRGRILAFVEVKARGERRGARFRARRLAAAPRRPRRRGARAALCQGGRRHPHRRHVHRAARLPRHLVNVWIG